MPKNKYRVKYWKVCRPRGLPEYYKESYKRFTDLGPASEFAQSKNETVEAWNGARWVIPTRGSKTDGL